MEDDLPDLKVDLPSYPDWKKGVKWGFVWGAGGVCALAIISFIIPLEPQMDVNCKHIPIGIKIIFSAWSCMLIFVLFGSFFGFLASFRPEFKQRNK